MNTPISLAKHSIFEHWDFDINLTDLLVNNTTNSRWKPHCGCTNKHRF